MPSNIVLIRLGPRVWLPIIIVAWGVVATLFAGLKSATDFYVLCFLLGVAESGSFPGTSLTKSDPKFRHNIATHRVLGPELHNGSDAS